MTDSFPSTPTTVVARVISNKTRDVNFVRKQCTQRAMLSFDLALVPGHQLFNSGNPGDTFSSTCGWNMSNTPFFYTGKSNTWATEPEGTVPCPSHII